MSKYEDILNSRRLSHLVKISEGLRVNISDILIVKVMDMYEKSFFYIRMKGWADNYYSREKVDFELLPGNFIRMQDGLYINSDEINFISNREDRVEIIFSDGYTFTLVK